MNELRSFMFKNVYLNKNVKKAEDLNRVELIITSLFGYYLKNPDKLPKELAEMRAEFTLEELVKDHIAGMTDRYAVNIYEEIFG